MMTPEQQIKQQLASGTRATADVANYEAKMRLAKALQEKQVSRSPDGYMSPFSVVAKVFDDSRARQLGRENRPLLEAARAQATEAINAKEQFGLDSALRKMRQDDTKIQQGQDRITQNADQYAKTMAFNQGKGLAVKLTNDAGDLISAKQGQDGFYYDQQGNRLGSDWYKYDKPASSSRYGSGRVSHSELKEMRKYSEKKTPFYADVESLNNELGRYAVGGDKQDMADIAGLGSFAGGRGSLSDAYRMGKAWITDDEENLDATMSKKVNKLLTGILKENAGTAQTATEVRNILKGYGLEGDSVFNPPQEVFVKAWPEILMAIKRGRESARATFTPEALAQYSSGLPEGGYNVFEHDITAPDFSNRYPELAPQTQDASVNSPAQVQEAPPEALDVGYVEDGYRYIGGDPSAESSWEAVQ